MSKELTPLEALEQLTTLGVVRTPQTVKEYGEIIETALKRLEKYEQQDDFLKDCQEYAFMPLEKKIKKLKALEIIKENIGLKMSVDEDIGCLYVPITKCFQPLEKNIVIVGYIQGKDKIDLLKEVLNEN